MRKPVFNLILSALRSCAAVAIAASLAPAASTAAPIAPAQSRLELRRHVAPDYPAPAKQFHIQGSVTLDALVGKDGRVRTVSVVDGHPALTQAAVRAVEKWEYAPYVVGNKTLDAPTRIVVNFRLENE